MLKISLKSDYSENYDKYFTKDADKVFERSKVAPFSREDTFYYLTSLGMLTPKHGLVESLVPSLFESYQNDDINIVVYKDIFLHDRNQLILVKAKKAFTAFKKFFACEYLEQEEEFATTYTYLKIGQRSFGVKTVSTSKDCWQSNFVYKSTIMCEGADEDYHPKMDFSLFSIDYVKSKGKLYAIDLNTSPTLKDTNINLFMSDEEIFDEITRAEIYFSKSRKIT